MRLWKLYLETSVFGFYFDSGAHNLEKVRYTRKLFQQIKEGRVLAYISPLVIEEISETPAPFGRKLVELLRSISCKMIDTDVSEVEWLANEYVRHKIIHTDYRDDAVHLAFAVLSDVNVLVTWNCKHLANEFRIHQVTKLNESLGLRTSLSIRTPEEVIIYE